MSKFSDKSDFGDTCLMHYTPDRIAFATILIDDVPLKINSPRDLIPYYGNIVTSMSSSEDNMCINVSKISQPRYREIDTIGLFIDEYVQKWRRAKRKKEQVCFNDFEYPTLITDRYIIWKRCEQHKDFLLKVFTPYAYNKEWMFNHINTEIIETLFSDIHTSTGNYYRRNLLDYAAEYWGEQYTLDKEHWVEWASSYDPSAGHNATLFRIQRATWDYEKMYNEALEELKLC